MKTLNVWITMAAVALLTGIQASASAATIPAGTTIVILTTNSIASDDPPGRQFDGVLANNVSIGGKMIVPAGTRLLGSVKSPHFTIAGTSRSLTLRLTSVVVRGRAIAITTNDLPCESNSPWTIGPNRRVQISGETFTYYAGTLIPFRLTQPVEI